MRILVTGGAGYIGSFTARRLADAGHEVTVLDDLSKGHRAAVPARAELIEGTIESAADVSHALCASRAEIVIHFAARSLVGESVREPEMYHRTNVVGSTTLVDASVAAGVSGLVFSSSAAVYGTPTLVPIGEDAPCAPINPYGETKRHVEVLLEETCRSGRLAAVSLRYFNAAGAAIDGSHGEDHDPETHLIPNLLRAAGTAAPFHIFGTDYPTPDGTCVRDYVHVIDLADAHVLAIESMRRGEHRVYNVGTGRGHSVREVTDMAQQVTGRPIDVREGPRREGDPPELVARADRIREETGFVPAHSDLETMIRTAWMWHRDNPDGYSTR